MKVLFPILVFSFCLQGCASFTYTTQFKQTGSQSKTINTNLEERSSRYEWDDLDNISVFISDLPQGISKVNGEYIIQNSSIHQIGKVNAYPSDKNRFTLFFDNYAEDENWRDVYCPVQGVLYWATFTLWAVTPFPWPCFVYESDDAEDISNRKIRIVNTLKKTAKAAGGNAIIITKFGDMKYDSEMEGLFLGYGDLEMTSAEALILKINP